MSAEARSVAVPGRGELERRMREVGSIDMQGYIRLYWPKHPCSHTNGYVGAHKAVAVTALGRPLPPGAVVHHVNEDKGDNRGANLVICEGRAYHGLLHQRLRALRACGNANWRKCPYCKTYSDPSDMVAQRRPDRTRPTRPPRYAHDLCIRESKRAYELRRRDARRRA